jgi:hypothetical protein
VCGRSQSLKLREYTRTWRTAGPLRRQRFYDILTVKGRDGVLDSDFLTLLHERRATAIKRALKLFSFQIPVLALLVLAILPLQASVSILGITPAASRGFREALVVISALMGVAASGLSFYTGILTEMIESYVVKLSKGDDEIKTLLGVAHGVEYFVVPNVYEKNVRLGWGFGAFLAILGIIAALLALAMIAAYLVFHLYILWDIYQRPSFSVAVSVCVVWFVLLADTLGLSINVLNGWPFAVRDYTNFHKLAEIQEHDPERYKRVIVSIVEQHHGLPWLLRKIVRPKMPKKLPD